MASNNSGPISPGSSYTLGEYVFTLQNVVSEDERIIQAHITGPEGSAAKGITVPSRAQLQSWRVEANETEASVYALIETPKSGKYSSPLDTSPVKQPIPAGTVDCIYENDNTITHRSFNGAIGCASYADNSFMLLLASPTPTTYIAMIEFVRKEDGRVYYHQETEERIASAWEYNNKTVYFDYARINSSGDRFSNGTCQVEGDISRNNCEEIAWTIIYGTPDDDELEVKEVLVARFVIDISHAGGGDWDVPSDTGEPYTTLHLDITGALSGRHNDPLFDTSYSYLPKANTNVKYYGCGGDGGHGGGGGAGASTVIVNEFGTSEASSKQINANAKRHGYGSGGGKGGKGGNGCIVIFY